MPSTLPDGDPVPADGSLPPQAYTGMAARTLSFYLHVPFCATRCGYCDFNTYTAGELGTAASPQSWLDAALAEIDLAAKVLGAAGQQRLVSTVFVGGGTPSLVGAGPLTELLGAVRERFGLVAGAEVTTEANPESTNPELLAQLREAGFTRLSLGMQSTSARVLQILDRTHTAGRALQVVDWARSAGFDHVNLDLIYGTPGETDAEFTDSLRAAIGSGVDHVSAYSLIVEPGTRLARQVRTGLLPMPDDDVLADRYLIADAQLSGAGLNWYEVSNWAANEAARCRHNLAYWTGGDWWGIGPGAHSHVGGVRWWNVKHPAAYAAALAAGRSPGHAREVLGSEARRMEEILLELRLAQGIGLDMLSAPARAAAAEYVTDGLLDADRLRNGRAVLTLSGRLLADGIALKLAD
ncbi:MAG: radical SAM family heme chaperone HemW [Nakamurella sp.]